MIAIKLIYTLILIGLASLVIGAAGGFDGLIIVGIACMGFVCVMLFIAALFAIWAA